MKDYPSTPRSTGQTFEEFDAYVFDKLDGSNLRWEWSKKQGWYKHGTRTRLFDESDEVFGRAIDIFQRTFAEPLARAACDNRWERVIVFTEFFGPNSFAGVHDPSDGVQLALIDIAPHKGGILGPREYLKIVEAAKVPHAEFLGHQKVDARLRRQRAKRARTVLVRRCCRQGASGQARPHHGQGKDTGVDCESAAHTRRRSRQEDRGELR